MSTMTDELPTHRTHVERHVARRGTRERLLSAGMTAVLESGWNATGVDKVLSSVGVPKGSFYHFFASKEAFGYALVDAYQVTFMKRMDRCFGDHAARANASLTHKLAAFLSESTVAMRRYGWRHGCLIGALGQELAASHEGFRERLQACVREWEALLAAAIRIAQQRGEVASGADARRLAQGFWASWEGALLRARLSRTPAPLLQAVEDFDQLLHTRGVMHVQSVGT